MPKKLLQVLILLSIPLLAALQAVSIYNYQGEKVDESELVHYAVGFLGGNLDPVWVGYGTFGMYLLGAIYFLVGAWQVFLGRYDSLLSYASELYEDHGFFIILARFSFALIGVVAALLYFRLGTRLKLPSILLGLFLCLQILGPEALTFANYVRCDSLVSFFIPCILLVITSNYSENKKANLLALIIAAACASKISAIFLLVILFFFCGQKYFQKKLGLRAILISLALFQVAVFVFQPYGNIYQRFWEVLEIMIFNSRLDAAKVGHFGFIAHSKAILTVFNKQIPWYLSSALIFSPLIYYKNKEFFIYSLLTLLLLVAPYYFSSEVTYYWFLPAFPLVRFLALYSAWLLLEKIIVKLTKAYALGLKTFAFCLITYLLLTPALSHYQSFVKTSLAQKTNALIAKQWLLENAYGRIPILLDAHYGYRMPKIYDPENLEEAKKVSTAFIFQRDKIEFLNQAFALFIERQKKETNPKSDEPFVKSVVAFDPALKPQEYEQRIGAYFVVSPSVYRRFLKNEGKNFDQGKKDFLKLMQDYYKRMLANPLVKSFRTGSGGPIEIYKVE